MLIPPLMLVGHPDTVKRLRAFITQAKDYLPDGTPKLGDDFPRRAHADALLAELDAVLERNPLRVWTRRVVWFLLAAVIVSIGLYWMGELAGPINRSWWD